MSANISLKYLNSLMSDAQTKGNKIEKILLAIRYIMFSCLIVNSIKKSPTLHSLQANVNIKVHKIKVTQDDY